MTTRISIPKRKRYIAGVDPGVYTGIAVFDRVENRIRYIKQTNFFGVIPWFRSMLRVSELAVFVEVPKMFIYSRNEEAKGGVAAKRDRFMANVGGNRREGQLLVEWLDLEGFTVQQIKPIGQKKWDDRQFRAITKWNGPASQHVIDAARIALANANYGGLEIT